MNQGNVGLKDKHVLLLSNVPSPYFSPIFSWLAESAEWNLNTCYISAWNQSVAWAPQNASHFSNLTDTILTQRFSTSKSWKRAQVVATFALLSRVLKERYDFFLIYGYTQLPQLFLIGWAVLMNIPFAIAGDANYYSDKTTGWKRLAKKCWLGWLTQRASAIVTVGTACRMFWEAYGAAPGKLFHVGFAVDNDFFRSAAVQQKNNAIKLKQEWGWGDLIVFIYAGRLIARKNVHLLISAIQRLANLPIALLIVGSGEEGEQLERQADKSPYIRFVGAATQAELPLYYALSDALVLPAREEPWGLVVNEAMASGLAVISHRHCGATLDLVDKGNGFVLQYFTVEEIVSALSIVSESRLKLESFKQKSLERICNWSASQAAFQLKQVIDMVIDRP